MTHCRPCLIALLAFNSIFSVIAADKRDVSAWEPEIQAFEKSDRTNPPPKGAILFVGSSSIRKWTTLAQDISGKTVINRGFGGSQIPDSTALAERIIFPYRPKIIVFYAGDNDLALGHTPDQVVQDYRDFVKKIHDRMPKTVIAYIAIKPSPLRWALHEKTIEVNNRIKAMSNERLKFIDIYPLMLGADGKPRPELYLEDGLHPSAKCYKEWAEVIKPFLN